MNMGLYVPQICGTVLVLPKIIRPKFPIPPFGDCTESSDNFIPDAQSSPCKKKQLLTLDLRHEVKKSSWQEYM